MADITLAQDEVLLTASRGTEARHGLWLWQNHAGDWQGRQIDTVNQLSSLTGHPTLPVVYGTAGVAQDGWLGAWHIGKGGEHRLSFKESEGAEPCHLVVDPTGRLLIATNYTTSTLALQPLASDGSFDGPLSLLKLSGGGPEVERQDDAHPHQAFFNGDTLVVIDLGADLVREFRVDPAKPGIAALEEIRTTPTPPGTGPRHGVVLPDDRLAISGELGENLITGQLGGEWADVRSTRVTGKGKARWDRNYPGDIQRSADGRHVYFANRSHNTIATFDVTGATPVLVHEIDTGVDWPQHILVRDGALLVAGWDSSRVVILPLTHGVPTAALPLFESEKVGWIHPYRIG